MNKNNYKKWIIKLTRLFFESLYSLFKWALILTLILYIIKFSFYVYNTRDFHKYKKLELYKVVNDIFYIHPYIATKKIEVPLNWLDLSDNKKITLSIYKIPRKNPKRIYVLIPGGPNQNALYAYKFAKNIFSVDKDSEIILFDHRGTGESTFLGCKSNVNINYPSIKSKECISEIYKKYGDDLKYFNSQQAAFDLKFILSNYTNIPITIYGGSYGTVVAEQLAKIGVPNVDTYILDSPAYPVVGKLNMNQEEALDNHLKTCTTNKSCNSIDEIKNINEFKTYTKYISNKCKFSSEYSDRIMNGLYDQLNYDSQKNIFDKLINLFKNCDAKEINSIIRPRTGEYYTELIRFYIESFFSGRNSTYMNSLIYCNEFDPTKKFCPSLPKYEPSLITDVQKSKNSRFLVISGLTDTITTPNLARHIFNILPDKKILLSVIGKSHMPLNMELCNANIAYKFSNGEKDIKNIDNCDDYSFKITSNYF